MTWVADLSEAGHLTVGFQRHYICEYFMEEKGCAAFPFSPPELPFFFQLRGFFAEPISKSS